MEKILKRVISSILSLAMVMEFAGTNFYEFIPQLYAAAETTEVSSEAVTESIDPTEETAGAVVSETEAVSETIVETEAATEGVVYEDWTITENQTLTGKKEVNNLTVSAGTLNLNENVLVVHGDILVNGGAVSINKGVLECENFTMSSGYFYMNNVNDKVIVNGDFLYQHGYMHDSYMTAGTIEVKGNFTSTGSYFRPTLEHKVVLNGDEKQEVSISGLSSKFNKLEIWNTSLEGVCSTLPIPANDVSGNVEKLHIAAEGSYGMTLTEDLTLEEDYCLIAGTIDLNGHTLTINGDLIQAGGKIILNGGTLNVTGDYRIQSKQEAEDTVSYDYSTGYLVMTNEADQLNVGGDFVTYSTQDHREYLTAGTMTIKGNFEQKRYDSYNNFSASGTHRVVFAGEKEHTVNFEYVSWMNYGYFANLDLGSETITLTKGAVVIGEVTGADCKMTGRIYLCNAGKVASEFGGDVEILSGYTLTEDMHIKGNLYISSTLNLNGYTLTVDGNVYVYNYLNLNNGRLECGGNFELTYRYGQLNMVNAEDTIVVGGNFTFDGGYYGSTLTNGTIYVAGDCTISRYGFKASNSHTVVINGTALQTVSVNTTAANFNKIVFGNFSEEGVKVATNLDANEIEIKDGCNVEFASSGSFGMTLTENLTLEEDYYLIAGTIDLNGHTLTINGDLIQAGGKVILNGGILNVTGDYRIQSKQESEDTVTYDYSTGYLVMTNEADQLNVGGDFVTYSTQDHREYLTAGTMTIKGNFEQKRYDSNYNFSASGTHRVVFAGGNEHTITFSDVNWTSYGYFANLDLGSEIVTLTNNAVVIGELTGADCKMTGRIYLCNTGKVASEFGGNVEILSGYTLAEDMHIKGDLYISSTLNLNGYTLTVDGNVYVYNYLTLNNGCLECNGNLEVAQSYGQLYMVNAEDKIVVNGNFVFSNGYKSYNSTMTDGTICVGADCIISGSHFKASGNHTVVINGTTLQTVSVNTTAANFNKIVFSNFSEEGVKVATNLDANEIEIKDGCNVEFANNGSFGMTLTEDLTLEEDYCLIAGTIDLNGHTLTINGDLIQAGGKIILNGGILEVKGDYRIQSKQETEEGVTYDYSTGSLVMTNEADQLIVDGDFITWSTQDHREYLTAGTMTIKGNFEQKRYDSNYNFSASGTHKVVFAGGNEHTIAFSDVNWTSCGYFANLDLGSETITLTKGAVVIGEVTGADCKMMGRIYLCNTGKVASEFGGDVEILSGYTLTEDMHIKGNLYISSTLNLNGYTLTVDGNVYVYNYLNLNNGRLECGGNFELTYRYGQLNMVNAEDTIVVGGNFTFDGGYYGSTLTNGTIYIAGDCTISRYGFKASNSHTVVINGTALQTVSVNTTAANFNKIVFGNFSEEGVKVATNLDANEIEIKDGCNVEFANNGSFGMTLTEDLTLEEDYCLIAGTIDLNGHTLTINGDLIQAGGKIILNGGTLNVTGDYRIQSKQEAEDTVSYDYSTGYLVMTNEADQLNVDGDFVTWSSQDHREYLNAGTMMLKGNFEQKRYDSYNNFSASGTHKIVFSGSEQQNIDIESYNYCYLNNVVFSSTSGVSINSNMYVNGQIEDTTGKISGNGYVYITDFSQVENGVFSGNIYMNTSQAVYLPSDMTLGKLYCYHLHLNGKNLTVDALEIYSSLHIESGHLECKGNLRLNRYSYFYMTNELDYVWVGGNFITDSQYTTSGRLTAGVLEINGDFLQTRNAAFVTEGTHRVIMSGKNAANGRTIIQTIKFNVPGTSRFNTLVITKPLGQYQFLNGSNASANPELFYNELIEDYTDTNAPSKVEGLVATEVKTKSVRLIWNASADDNAVMGYEIYRDNLKIYTTSATEFVDNSLQPETTYLYEIYAFDASRNYSESSGQISVTSLKDTEDPTIPQNLSVKTRTGSSIVLTWNPSQDNVKTEGYIIYCGGEEVGRVSETTYKHTGLEAGEEYSYQICAYDAAMNTSELSDTITGTPVNPTISSITPADYREIGGVSQTITVVFPNVGNSTGNKVKFEYKQSGEDDEAYKQIEDYLIGQQNYSTNYLCAKCNWNLTNLNGNYDVRVTLYDADDNYCTKVVSYIVDTQGSATPQNFTATPVDGRVELQWNPSTSANCSYYNIYRASEGSDDFVCIAKISDPMNCYYMDGDVEQLATYSYKISAVSEHGNEGELSEAVSVTVTEDEEVPSVNSIMPEASRVNATTVVVVSASDNITVEHIVLSYKASADAEWTELATLAATNGTARYSWNTTVLSDGNYNMRAVAIDANGNMSDAFTNEYAIDNTGPVQVEINAEECTTASSFVSIRWADIEETHFGYYVVECMDENGEFTEVGRTSTTAGMHIENRMPDTEYTFRVVAYDDLGNRGIESETIVLQTTSDTISPGIKSFYPANSAFQNTIPLSITAADNIAAEKLVLRYSYDEGEEKTWTNLSEIAAEEASATETFSYTFDVSEMAEGIVFVEAVAYDTAGNNSKAVVMQYKIDRTAPEAITDLNAAGNSGNIHLTWSVADSDVKTFEIYRAEDGKTTYSKIADCTTKDYYDTSVDFGAIYTYKVIAVDIAGNKSADSNEAIAQASEDLTAPTVLGFTPGAGSGLCANPDLEVVATDNHKLASVTVSYQKADSADGIWHEIGTYEMDSNYQSVAVEWDTTDLEDGQYLLQAIAVDVTGNVSEAYSAEYALKTTAPTAAVLELFQGNFELTLEWNEVTSEDFSFYRLYKKHEDDKEYQLLGNTRSLTYTDTDVIPGEIYSYKVEAYDTYGNFSVSNEIEGFAYDVDTVAPVINVPEDLSGLTGYELMFDGTASTDNVRITEYIWDMGDGNTEYGGRVAYSYAEPGEYLVTLTAIDAKENSSTETINVTVLDPTEYGSIQLAVVDENNKPIKYAYVYVYTEDTGIEKSFKADSNGLVNITAALGSHDVAVYKEGYLPVRTTVDITKYGDNGTQKVTLEIGELVTGNITVHRMTLEEMIEAGVDFNDPSNSNTYTFEVELTFAQEPIPTVVQCIGGGGGGSGTSFGSGFWLDTNITLSDGSDVQLKAIIPETPKNDEEEEIVPILAYVRTSASISFMKEMYAVDLGVINNATSEFVIEDCYAELKLPDGLSLAATTNDTNTFKQDMGDIAGQERKTVSWTVAGDKKGEYHVEADFCGTLMPFDVPVNATFKTENPFVVGVGKGLHLYIYPEDLGYIDEYYYIQYALTNEGSDTFYNLTTTFGPYEEAGYVEDITITNPDGSQETITNRVAGYKIPGLNECRSVPVLYNGQYINIGMFVPGDVLYGTYKQKFVGEGNPDEVRYRLIQALVTGLEDTDIQVHIVPIPTHIHKQNVKVEIAPSYWADPVDMTTGAFTEEVSLLSVMGESSPLSMNLSYNSLLASGAGDLGYGWSHDYEAYLDIKGNNIDVHWNAGSYASFVSELALTRNVNGELVEDFIVLDETAEIGYLNYRPISYGMEGYLLSREEDGTYTLHEPSGQKLLFDTSGKLTKIVQPTGKSISLKHTGNTTVITDDITDVGLILEYNAEGLLTVVKDGSGRTALLTYENGLLKTVTNAENQTITYTYDEGRRLTSATAAGEETPYVVNVYDENCRVVKQHDGLGKLTEFSYETDENYVLTAKATDRIGNTVTFVSDSLGRVLSVTDQNGNTTSYTYDRDGNMTSEINGKGDSITYTYDTSNNLTSVQDYDGNITSMTYDEDGNILTVSGPNGEGSSYTYNAKNLLETTSENSGIRRTYTYNGYGQVLTESITGLGVKYYEYENGRIKSVTDFMGNTTEMFYDAVGNLEKTIDCDGMEIVYHYDALGRMISTTTPDGSTSYTYDVRGNQTSMTDPLGNTTYYTYDNNNQLISATNAKGEIIRYTYDAEGRLVKTEYPDGTTEEHEYDAVGNVIKTVNANGEVTEYVYDKVDQVVSQSVVNGEETYTEKYEYYANGKLKKVTFADGTSESYEYDTSWRLTKVTDALGNATVMAYDKAGNLISSTDAEGNVTSYTYDIYGRMLSATDPNGNTTIYDEYDKNGNCLQITLPNGLVVNYTYSSTGLLIGTAMGEITTSYTYDTMGRVKTYTDEEGHTFTVTYDANGNVLSLLDADGNVIEENQYDELNNLVLTKDALGIETQYEYDSMGQIKTIIENLNTARQTETAYDYDALGRLLSVKDAEDGTASYEYDQVGNITAMIDPNGGRTEYTYDSMGRVTASLNAIGSRMSYTYNAAGLLETAQNAKGQETSYTYYKNGWIKSFTDELGTVSYTYDGNGNVLTVTDENGTITREYDEMNRVTKYTDFRGNTIGYSYDQIGNLLAITYPGGRIVRYSYYKTGAVKTVTDWDDRVTTYEYDNNGRLTKTSRPDGSIEIRTYDAAGRLLSQADKVGETVINARDYIYDEAGNITNITASNGTDISNLTSAEMAYDAANRLIKYNGEEVKYDADGNMIYGPLNGEMSEFVYDCRNRLVSAGGVTYEYDAENNRISKTAGETKTEYVIDTSNTLSHVLTATTGKATTYYVFGIGLLYQEEDGEMLFYHFNNIGSTEAVTDESGQIVETFAYGPYGELLSANECGIMYLYNGEYGVATDENGLYYMRARYYNSEIKRFVNQDVLTGTISDSPTMNRYAYVNGNPISLADPFGLSPSLNWLGHAALDVLGLIPGLGAVFDVVNAVWYLAEGDYFSAFCSIISVLPVVGDAIGLMGKGTKLACGVQKGLHIAANMGSLFKSTYVVGNVIKNNIDRYLINGEEFSWSQLGVDLLTIGLEVFAMKNAAKGLADAQSQSWCFVAGTLVATEAGYKAIEEIEAGDTVLAENPETGEVAYKTVLETYENETNELVHVHVNGEIISATPTHPFYVNQFGWTRAADLRAGDVLVLSNGEYVVVEFVQHEILESPVKVYNFEVEGFHTYFVGESSVLVHNECGILDDNGSIPLLETKLDFEGKTNDHHIIPKFRGNSKPYADFISERGIDVDLYTITVTAGKGGMHMNLLHGKGKWNQRWMEFIDNNPNATAKDIFQFAGRMMDEYGLTEFTIHPYGE